MQVTETIAVVAGLRLSNGSLDRAEFCITVQHEFECRRVRRQELLGDVRGREIGRHLEVARVGLEVPAHERQQARLSAAVFAGDAYLLASEEAEGGAGE